MSGKEINLTSDNTTIKSNNFNVDKNGSIECNNISIKSGKINLKGNGNFVIVGPNDNATYIDGNNMLLGKYENYIDITYDDEGENSIALITHDNSTWIHPSGINTPNIRINNEGYAMYGMNEHKYRCAWINDSQLQFWVDTTNVATLSDKRLKTEIQDIDENFIKAIEEVEMKQFKVANRNGLISFGILAQDLIEIFEKYNKKPFDYEIVYETQYKTDDDTIYYTINYEQFLILKQKAIDRKLEQLQEEDKQKDELIGNLIKRIETLEKGVNK